MDYVPPRGRRRVTSIRLSLRNRSLPHCCHPEFAAEVQDVVARIRTGSLGCRRSRSATGGTVAPGSPAGRLAFRRSSQDRARTTATTWPPITMVPVRVRPALLASAVRLTREFPAAGLPDGSLIQVSPVATSHQHDVGAVTSMLPAPPKAGDGQACR
jgi:hypothetical protein